MTRRHLSLIDSLTMQQISTFCCVYECGSYACAAEELGFAGPTLWEQVKSLEKIYRSKLFIRSGRNIVGSPDMIGRKLLDQARFRLGLKKPFQIAVETDSSAITIACVRAGLGIGVIASLPGGRVTSSVQTRSIAAELGHVNVVAAFRRGRLLSDALRRVIDLVTSNRSAA